MFRVEFKVIFSFSALIMMNMPQSNAKVLNCPQAEMLNIAFQGLPYALARIKIAHRSVLATQKILVADAKNISKSMPTEADKNTEAALVATRITKIFEPIKEFLSEIRRCSFFITPLLERSLSEKAAKKSYLFKFMHSSSGLIEFFAQEITNKEKLSEVCEELNTFFTDMEDSMTPETLKAYAKFIQDVKQSQKNMHHDDKGALKFLNLEPVSTDKAAVRA